MTLRSLDRRHTLAALVCVWACAGLYPTASSAYVPGVPTPPRPGPVPSGWGGAINDAFGGGLRSNADDFRTQTLYGALRFGEERRWTLGIDYSFLTNKGRSNAARVDELTLTVGRTLFEREDRKTGRFAWLVAGLGGRYTGDLAGEKLQNEWHDLLDFAPVHLPYETTSEAHGVAFVHGSWLGTRFPGAAWWPRGGSYGTLGLGLNGSLLVTSSGEVQGALEGRLVLLGRDGTLWAGVRRGVREGDTPDATTAAVARREEGWWLTYGASLGNVFFEGSQHLDSDAAVGRIGWLWRPPADPPHGEARMAGEAGAILNGPGLGLALRWHSAAFRRLGSWGERTAIITRFAYGNAAGDDPPDQEVRFQQFLVGLDLELRSRGPGFQVVPFVYLTAGVRWEQVEDDGPSPVFPETSASAVVLQGGAGLRFLLGARAAHRDGLRYAVGLSVDGWYPSSGARDSAPGVPDFRFLEPHITMGLRLSVLTDW